MPENFDFFQTIREATTRYMEAENVTQKALGVAIDVTQQAVAGFLEGTSNLTRSGQKPGQSLNTLLGILIEAGYLSAITVVTPKRRKKAA